MIGKTRILTGLAALAVVGSAAVPFVASAQQSGSPSVPATAPQHGGKHASALAAALGVTPEALATAMKAAREATPRLTLEQARDQAAREAHRAAFQAALAANLGITVEALQAAQRSVAPAAGGRMGPLGFGGGLQRKAPGGPTGLHAGGNAVLASALGIDVATLAAAQKAVREELPKPAFTRGIPPDRAALEALKAQHDAALAAKLGISVDALQAAQEAAQEKVRTDFRAQLAARTQEMFDARLAKAVAAGKITQAKADELKAQFARGGEAARSAIDALREAISVPERPQRGPGLRLGGGPLA